MVVHCKECQANGKQTKLAYHSITKSLMNHLKSQHQIDGPTAKGVSRGDALHGSSVGQKIEAFQAVPASNPGDELTKKEYIAGLWARKGLSYSLIDDWMFRKQFGVCVPVGVLEAPSLHSFFL